jgi:hypothetical protein
MHAAIKSGRSSRAILLSQDTGAQVSKLLLRQGRPRGPMTITDPTALHSPKRSIVSKATQWTINTLAPLREHLSPWPAGLPSKVGDPIRPLKIGVRADLAVLLPDGEAHEVLSRVLRRYTRGREYGAALAAPDALRHDLAGNPVEPATRSNRWPRSIKLMSGRRPKPLSPQRRSPRRPSLCPSRSKP